MGKVAWNSYLTQLATENKVIHTLIIDLFSHGLGSVKIEQELEKKLLLILIWRPSNDLSPNPWWK